MPHLTSLPTTRSQKIEQGCARLQSQISHAHRILMQLFSPFYYGFLGRAIYQAVTPLPLDLGPVGAKRRWLGAPPGGQRPLRRCALPTKRGGDDARGQSQRREGDPVKCASTSYGVEFTTQDQCIFIYVFTFDIVHAHALHMCRCYAHARVGYTYTHINLHICTCKTTPS